MNKALIKLPHGEHVDIPTYFKWVRYIHCSPIITQRQLAEKLGLSIHMVNSIECGRRKPSDKIMDKIKKIVE